MEKTSKIYVAGHRGMVGSAIVRIIAAQGKNAPAKVGAFVKAMKDAVR